MGAQTFVTAVRAMLHKQLMRFKIVGGKATDGAEQWVTATVAAPSPSRGLHTNLQYRFSAEASFTLLN